MCPPKQQRMTLAAGVAPADLLLLMAASENDAPKVAELLRAGADTSAKVSSKPRLKWISATLLS